MKTKRYHPAISQLPSYSDRELSDMRSKGARVARYARLLLEDKNK